MNFTAIFFAFFATIPHALAAPSTSALSQELQEFLGAPPARFEQRFRKPAQQLRSALEHKRGKKLELAIKELSRLSESGQMAEHALYELANAWREKKEYAKSSLQAAKLIRSFPGSPYLERMQDLLDENECEQGVAEARGAKTALKRELAGQLLQRCLARSSWKEWDKREAQTTALYEILKTDKDPLLGPFVAELIQALPSSSPLRLRLAREQPNEKLEAWASVARFRSKSATPAGVKAVYPDLELFESGMKAVLKEQWPEAYSLFRRLTTEYPSSEHLERALYWLARTEEKTGRQGEAQKHFEQILAENPLTYYGLQSALHLKKDPALLLQSEPLDPPAVKFEGSPLTRQALSLWKLRALLELGLVDTAREEAKFLFQLRPGGSTLGQEDALGALRMAGLFRAAGYHLGTFSHAYAALSLDPTLLNPATLDYVFPQLYEKEFGSASETTGVHPLLLLSVSKQESAFVPNAVSRSDALGLMQLLFTTAREVLPKVGREELFQPDTNIQAGARYLQKLLERFQGNIGLALAAYNAGPNRAAQWQKEILQAPVMKQGFDPDVFIDTIPFTETRKYVGNILRNFAWYRLLTKESTVASIQELQFQWQRPKKESNPTPKVEEPSAPKNLDISDHTAGL